VLLALPTAELARELLPLVLLVTLAATCLVLSACCLVLISLMVTVLPTNVSDVTRAATLAMVLLDSIVCRALTISS